MWNKVIKSLLAGICIGIGGAVFVSTVNQAGEQNKIMGAFLFSFGLFYICHSGYLLYTGRIGYFFDFTWRERLELLLTLLMNCIGVIIMGWILKGIQNEAAEIICNQMIETKLNMSYFSFFIRAIFCGMMMVFAVEGFKNFSSTLSKILAVIASVVIFILAGFEHSIADLFYVSFASISYLGGEILLKLLLAVLGNTVGSILLYNLMKLAKKDKLGKKVENEKL